MSTNYKRLFTRTTERERERKQRKLHKLEKNPPTTTQFKHLSQDTRHMYNIANIKAHKHLAQKFKWCVFVLCVISEDAFQKGDDSEKIEMEISGILLGLEKTARPAQVLASPADQRHLWTEAFVTVSGTTATRLEESGCSPVWCDYYSS